MKCNKILRIIDSVPDGSTENYTDINNINNLWPITDISYVVPYNTLFYQSNQITPVFFGRSFIKINNERINTNYNALLIHPSFCGYTFPPLIQKPCVCSKIYKGYDDKLNNDLNIKNDNNNNNNNLEIRKNQIHGIIGEYCYDNFHKPILNFDCLKVDSNTLLKYLPDVSTTPTVTTDNSLLSSSVFSNKDKEILNNTLSLFQNRVEEIKHEEDLTINKPNYRYTTEPLDLYELINIDNNCPKNVYKHYTSAFKQMMLQLEDYNSIRHLNTSDMSKIIDNKEIEKKIRDYSCLRCELSNLNFSEYIEHICYKCKYNIYPCKLMTTCAYNFSSQELYYNHIRNCHRSRSYDINNSIIDAIPLQNIEIEIKRNEQWFKGIVKSFSNVTCLHEVEINGVIENISLADQEFRYIQLTNDVLIGDYDKYTKLVYDQNLRILDKYLDSHRIEINSNIHVLIGQQLFEGKLIGLNPEKRTFQVILTRGEIDESGNNEIKEIPLGHIFHPSEYRRPNRKGTLLFHVDDSNLPIENHKDILRSINNNNNNNNNSSFNSSSINKKKKSKHHSSNNNDDDNNNDNNNSPYSSSSSSLSDRNSDTNNNNSSNNNTSNVSSSENSIDFGALSLLKGNWEHSDSDEPHNSESGSSDEAPTQPMYDISEFLKGRDKSDVVEKKYKPGRGGARRGAGRRKIVEIIEEPVRKGRGRGRGRGRGKSRGRGRGSGLWRGNS